MSPPPQDLQYATEWTITIFTSGFTLITDYCACRGNGKNYESTLRCMANWETFDVNHSVWGNTVNKETVNFGTR